MRPPIYRRGDYGFHYPQQGYRYQPQAQYGASYPPYYPSGQYSYNQVQYPQVQYPQAQYSQYQYPQYQYPQYQYPQVQSQAYPQYMPDQRYLDQGYYYQPVYHCPTCGTPVYVVLAASPQSTPNGVAALMIAILVLVAIDVVFLR
ncbi:MAG: hypothetical protein M0Z55_13405 [Peptococcaceae bacterium]|nr:hypothetical protein [Peptococcaceae bacterium]